MLDALDMQVRLSALDKALSLPTLNGMKEVGPVLVVAAQFYAFLTGSPNAATEGLMLTLDPLPLAGEPPIETGAVVAANEAIKRTRRTKAEMEAARAGQPLSVVHEALTPAELVEANAILATAQATAAGPAPAAEITAAPATIAEVKAAFMRVVETEGLGPKAGSALIKQFGVERISSLPEKDFAAAVAACDEAVAGAGK